MSPFLDSPPAPAPRPGRLWTGRVRTPLRRAAGLSLAGLIVLLLGPASLAAPCAPRAASCCGCGCAAAPTEAPPAAVAAAAGAPERSAFRATLSSQAVGGAPEPGRIAAAGRAPGSPPGPGEPLHLRNRVLRI